MLFGSFGFLKVACSQSKPSHVYDLMRGFMRPADVRYRGAVLSRRTGHCLDIAKVRTFT